MFYRVRPIAKQKVTFFGNRESEMKKIIWYVVLLETKYFEA